MSEKWGESDETGSLKVGQTGATAPGATAPGATALGATAPPQQSKPAAFSLGPHSVAAPGLGTVISPPPAAIPITVRNHGRAWRALVEAVDSQLAGREGIWALEAGAGTRPLFDLPEDAFIVGVDRDARTLERNTRLDQRVTVELAEYEPLAAGFDLINCWYVLDGLPDPAPVLDRFAEWTALGGLVVIAVPNLLSPHGLFSRLTGRTKLRRPVSPTALRRRFVGRGFTPVFQAYFEDTEQAARRRRLGLTRRRWRAVQALVRVLTFGVLDAARTDYIAVFRRCEE
jgi:SAM-dependent methyltransferase